METAPLRPRSCSEPPPAKTRPRWHGGCSPAPRVHPGQGRVPPAPLRKEREKEKKKEKYCLFHTTTSSASGCRGPGGAVPPTALPVRPSIRPSVPVCPSIPRLRGSQRGGCPRRGTPKSSSQLALPSANPARSPPVVQCPHGDRGAGARGHPYLGQAAPPKASVSRHLRFRVHAALFAPSLLASAGGEGWELGGTMK